MRIVNRITMIELINLTKRFAGSKNEDPFVALNNVNLKIEKGDIYGIIGLSGAGKSTLVRCINLLEKPDSGNILIDGEDIIGVYKAMRDYCVFTTKRVISVNVQGMTGKKRDYTSLPYSKVSAYSVETAGVLDLDSELEMYFSGLGKVKFEFTGNSNIVAIGKAISQYILK